jgi:L-malate glycosyltransferase
MTRVLIIEKRMTHYRVPMFEKLRTLLADRGIELLVGYGPCHASERSRNDAGALDWATHVPTLYLAGGKICLQSFGAAARTCDLLVVTQENKLVSNLVHQFLPTRYKVALWGHGGNLQGDPHSLAEKWKRFVSRRADWWFAYTDFTLPLLEQSGFDMRKVTVLGNSIDTRELTALCAQSEAEGQEVIRTRLGVPRRAFTGLYLGTFNQEKRIDFLLEAAQDIRLRIPDFELILAGLAPSRSQSTRSARKTDGATRLAKSEGV